MVRAWTAVLLLGGAVSLQAQSAEKSFACEVHTEAGVSGLVVAQAEDMKKAKEMVKNASALTLAGDTSRARSVVQCIDARKGRFSDATFQSFYEKLPK